MLTYFFRLATLATLVDFAGTLLIAVGAARTLLTFLRERGSPAVVGQLQRSLAADLVTALSIKSGAGLVRTLTVTTWTQFGLVIAIIVLRFFLGQTLKILFRQTSRTASSIR